MTIVFASLLLLIEEVQNVFIHYKDCKLIQSFTKKRDSYEKLSPEEKKALRLFYEAKVRQLDGAQKLICRESSIQVALQLTLILYQEIFKDNLTPNQNPAFLYGYYLPYGVQAQRFKSQRISLIV